MNETCFDYEKVNALPSRTASPRRPSRQNGRSPAPKCTSERGRNKDLALQRRISCPPASCCAGVQSIPVPWWRALWGAAWLRHVPDRNGHAHRQANRSIFNQTARFRDRQTGRQTEERSSDTQTLSVQPIYPHTQSHTC